MSEVVTIDIRDLAKDMTIEVRITGCREFRFRIWLAGLLVGWASRVAGMGFALECRDDSEQTDRRGDD